MVWTIVFGSIFGIMSLVAFILYVADKSYAVHGKMRIPEKVLLAFSFFGGGIGGYLAMFIARHKTKKWYFHVVNILGIVLQVGVMVALWIAKA